jgi:hypothetical protein
MSASAKPHLTAAVKATCQRIEKLLGKNAAFRKVEETLYVVKQGSTVVMMSVHPWKQSHAVVRLAAQLVKGVTMVMELALDLLELNSVLRFGAFSYVPAGEVIVFVHTLADRELSDEEEFVEAIRDFAIVADEYDDRIAAKYGGQTMEELLEEAVLDHLRRGPEHPFLSGASPPRGGGKGG